VVAVARAPIGDSVLASPLEIIGIVRASRDEA